MSQRVHLTIKSSIFDRQRKLTIEEGFIEFDDKDLKSAYPTVLLKNDVTGIKYGVEWISGYYTTFARTYCVDVLGSNNRIIKIRLKSVYGVRKTKLFNKYSKIINALYDNFIYDIAIGHFKKFVAGKDLFIAGIRLTHTGVMLSEAAELITWANVAMKKYITYYSVHSISNPEKYTIIEYLTEWESAILYCLLDQIIKSVRRQSADKLIGDI